MKPTTFTISVFFQRERRYVVPLFQRSYVWERQWKPFWEDIITIANQLIEGSEKTLHHLHNHFMGAVVLNKIDTFGHQVVADEIIDGQQRLTTIQVFLVALRDFLKISGDDLGNKNWLVLKKVTENELFDDDAEQYKVCPTLIDRKVFEDIYTLGSPEKLEQAYPLTRYYKSRYNKPRHRLVEAYLYFYRVIGEYVSGQIPNIPETIEEIETPPGTIVQRKKALIDALTLNFEIVVIELEEKDDPQTIFQTLNYLGEPLLPSDLIRNFVFLEAMRQNKPVEPLFKQYWQEYFNPATGADIFWGSVTRQGRLNRPTFDLFIFHYLICKTEREIPVTYLFQEFRDWWFLEAQDIETNLIDIQEQSHIFKRFLLSPGKSRIDIFARRLRIMDTSTVYPLILFLFGEKKNEISETDLTKIAIDLESFLVRRMVCGLTTKNYNRLFLTFLRNLKEIPIVTYQVFRDLLLSQTGDSVRWPDDIEFERAWKVQPVYKNIGASRTIMILDAIDMALNTSRQENVPLDGEISVEHVMPQNTSAEGWKLIYPSEANEQNRLELNVKRMNIIQTFGNLTLITGSLNSGNKDHPFSKKRPRLTTESKLMLNNYFQGFKDEDDWLEFQIETRGETLFKTALSIWPR
jgi:hypothetical protein